MIHSHCSHWPLRLACDEAISRGHRAASGGRKWEHFSQRKLEGLMQGKVPRAEKDLWQRGYVLLERKHEEERHHKKPQRYHRGGGNRTREATAERLSAWSRATSRFRMPSRWPLWLSWGGDERTKSLKSPEVQPNTYGILVVWMLLVFFFVVFGWFWSWWF